MCGRDQGRIGIKIDIGGAGGVAVCKKTWILVLEGFIGRSVGEGS
jgi:hypothetical protein